MTRQEILDRIEAINRDPEFVSTYGEASTAAAIIEAAPQAAIDEWASHGDPLVYHVYASPGKNGSITLRWYRTSQANPELSNGLSFETTGYGAASVTLTTPSPSRMERPAVIQWQTTEMPWRVFASMPDAPLARTLESLFAAYFAD